MRLRARRGWVASLAVLWGCVGEGTDKAPRHTGEDTGAPPADDSAAEWVSLINT